MALAGHETALPYLETRIPWWESLQTKPETLANQIPMSPLICMEIGAVSSEPARSLIQTQKFPLVNQYLLASPHC